MSLTGLAARSSADQGGGRAAIILAFGLGTLLSLIPLAIAALLLGRLAGDLGFSGNYLAAAFCIFGGLYLLDWLPLPQLGRGLPQPATRGPWTALPLGLVFGLSLGRAACGVLLLVVAGVLIDSA